MNDVVSGDVTINCQVSGSGQPVTCFVPGLAQTIADTRPFGSGVAGTRVFMDLRGHGGSTAPADAAHEGTHQGWTFDALADDVEAVANVSGANRALGVSLGAGALLALLVRQPARFERVVLALPSAIDQARGHEAVELFDHIADAVAANDQITLVRLLLQLQPPAVRQRPDIVVWARRHASQIGGTAVQQPLRALARAAPVASRTVLEAVDVPVLVLAQRDDPVHPVATAEALTSALPNAELVVSDVPWIWSARAELREAIAGFLNR
ncbi:MAG TPA: alpha/beta hydrolase [Actinomycetes bacterium]|nr:alpha/beta hydrolase [Actinomycetes bacterium]